SFTQQYRCSGQHFPARTKSRLQLLQLFHDFSNSLSQIASRHQIKRPRTERFHKLLELIKDVVHVEAKAQVIHAAAAIAFDLNRPPICAAFEQSGACDDDEYAQGTTLSRTAVDLPVEEIAEECPVVLRSLKRSGADVRTHRFLHRLHQRTPIDALEVVLLE